MYSLLSAAVLASDLARHPSGSRVADVVDRVLALRSDEVAALPPPAPDAVRERVLATCADQAAAAESSLEAAVQGLRGAEGLTRLGTTLERRLLGTWDDLQALLLREAPLRDLAGAQRQVCLDAVTAAWAGRSATLADLQALAGPWQRALDPVPPALPERPWTPPLRRLLEQVPRRSGEQWQACARAHRAGARDRWSSAVHRSAVAAQEHGRLHDLARAQLAAARALALTATPVPATTAAMVVTAAVQGLVTADLVAPDVSAALGADWEAGA